MRKPFGLIILFAIIRVPLEIISKSVTQFVAQDREIPENTRFSGIVVEAGGVEPPSENASEGTSPCAVGCFGLRRFPFRQASQHA